MNTEQVIIFEYKNNFTEKLLLCTSENSVDFVRKMKFDLTRFIFSKIKIPRISTMP